MNRRVLGLIIVLGVLLVVAGVVIVMVTREVPEPPVEEPTTKETLATPPPPPPPPPFVFVEKRITDLGPTPPKDVRRAYRSPDGAKLAYVVKRGWDSYLLVNGVESPPYDKISSVKFSPDGTRLMYAATKSGKAFLVLDGEKGPEYEYILRPRFSPDGRHVTYAATDLPRSQRYVVVWDGKVGRDYFMMITNVRFSPDSRHIAYRGRRGGKAFIVIDGIEGPPHDFVRLLHAGKRVRYAVRDGYEVRLMEADWPGDDAGDDDKIIEIEVKPIGTLPTSSSHWGLRQDQQDLAVWFRYKKKEGVIFGGKRSADYKKAEYPRFSPDWQHIAFTAQRDDGKHVVVRDLEDGSPYDAVGTPVFSRDGRLAYKAKRGDRWLIVCDGKAGPAFAAVGNPVFSRDGKHLAYTAKTDAGTFIIRDGERGVACALTDRPVFSPDSAHLLCIVTRGGGRALVCDRAEGPVYEAIDGLRFSRDGRHLLYVARRNGKWFMVCDGVAGPPHDKVWIDKKMNHQTWPDDVFRYLTLDAGREALVEVPFPLDRDWTALFD